MLSVNILYLTLLDIKVLWLTSRVLTPLCLPLYCQQLVYSWQPCSEHYWCKLLLNQACCPLYILITTEKFCFLYDYSVWWYGCVLLIICGSNTLAWSRLREVIFLWDEKKNSNEISECPTKKKKHYWLSNRGPRALKNVAFKNVILRKS